LQIGSSALGGRSANSTTSEAVMTVLQITAKPEPDQAGDCCQDSASHCACQADGAIAAAPQVRDDHAAAGGNRVMRTSSYVIYVDLPDNDSDMLIVHGYTGAFDKVSKRIATFLRAKEDRKAPRPLYGDWTPDPVIESVPDIPGQYQEVLLRRGYLTMLTREEELTRFRMLADEMHSQASAPSYVLMPTYDCNLRCFYCFQDHMRTKPDFAYLLKRMTPAMVDRIFDAMPQIEALHGIVPENHYTRPITLFGGEPLLRENRDLIEHILDRALEGGTKMCSVVTNATDLDAYEDLLGSRISPLQITIDGPPEEHDKRRVYADGRGSFDRIIANITRALDCGATVQVRLNVDRGNIGQLPAVAQVFVDQGWEERPGFSAYATVIAASNDKTDRDRTFSSWELDQELAIMHETQPVMRVITPKDSNIRQRATAVFARQMNGSLHASFCSAHSGMYVIDRFGDMYACWERTGNSKIRIGRIRPDSTIDMNQPMANLWRNRSVTSNPVCRQCRYALYCGGGCAVLAEGRKGRIDANYCDGYAFRFRSMVAEAYREFAAGAVTGEVRPTAGATLMDL
jgi:uncharacterized protein